MTAQKKSKQGEDGQLGNKDFCGSHPDLRTRMVVYTGIRLPGNGTPHHIDDAQQVSILSLGLPDGRKGVGRLSRLAHGHDKGVRWKIELPVTKFRGQFDFDIDFRQLFENISSHGAGIIGGTASDDDHMPAVL